MNFRLHDTVPEESEEMWDGEEEEEPDESALGLVFYSDARYDG